MKNFLTGLVLLIFAACVMKSPCEGVEISVDKVNVFDFYYGFAVSGILAGNPHLAFDDGKNRYHDILVQKSYDIALKMLSLRKKSYQPR